MIKSRWTVFAVALVAVGEWGRAGVVAQDPGADFLAFQAEDVDAVLNPDALNDVRYSLLSGLPESPAATWSVIPDAAALDGQALRAPPSPHKQTSDSSLQESIAVFPLRFVSAGTYQCYLRVRNNGTVNDGGTDSLWAPADWGEVNPSDSTSTGKTGGYDWVKPNDPGTFTVSAGEVGTTLDFRVGVRESLAHLDAVVFSTQSSLNDATLDDLVPSAPPSPPPPTSGVACVSTMTELNRAIAAAAPGDTILMCNGVWTDVIIDFDADGLPGQPITLRAEVDGQVRLEGKSRLQIAGDHLVVQGLHFTNGTVPDGSVIEFRGGSSDLANHSRLTECAMSSYNPTDPATSYKWVSVYGISNRVDHCHFSGMNHKGVTLTVWLGTGAPANHTRIDGNYFGDRAAGNVNGFETIRIGTSTRSDQSSLALVESNYFYRCNGEIEIISNKSVGNVFRRNMFVECDGQLTLRHGRACTVEGNYFLGNNAPGSSGVRIVGPDHQVLNNYFADLEGTGSRAALAIMSGVPDSPPNRYLPAEDDLIAFNTFVDCAETFALGTTSSAGDTTVPPKDCVIANNIVRSSHGPLINVVNAPINLLYEGNIMFGAATGVGSNPGIQVTNPQLVLAADGLQRPATNSPAVNGAVGTYSGVLVDLDGDVRMVGTQDIGADEVVAGPPRLRPFFPEQVGPRWMRPNSPLIGGVSFTLTDAEVIFEDLTGLAPVYTLERRDHLVTGTWVAVTHLFPVAYTSAQFNVTDPAPIPHKAYWRIKAMQIP